MRRIVDEPYFTYSAYDALTSGIQVKCPKCHGTGVVTADEDNAYFRCLSCGHQVARDRTIHPATKLLKRGVLPSHRNVTMSARKASFTDHSIAELRFCCTKIVIF